MRLTQGGVCVAVTAWLLCQSQPAPPQDKPTYKLVAPEIAARDEVFTGIVVKETDQGDVPVTDADGMEAEVRGQVVSGTRPARVVFTAPAKVLGNYFFTIDLARPAPGGKTTVATLTHHVEFVSSPQTDAPKIARASEFTGRNRYLTVEGQGLDKLSRAALVDPAGKEIALAEPVGSSLQKLYPAPPDLPNGAFRFTGWDAQNRRIQAPNETVHSAIKLEGPTLRRRGQRGDITVTSDRKATVTLIGGAPQLSLDRHSVEAPANRPVKVGFTAVQLGPYRLRAVVLNRGELPPGQEPVRAAAKQQPSQVHYDPATNTTEVTTPVQITDTAGKAIPNAPVDTVTTHPGGVEFGATTTGADGRATVRQTVPGRHLAEVIATHIFRVPGYLWKLPCDLDIQVLPGPPISGKFLNLNPPKLDYARPVRLAAKSEDRDLIRLVCRGIGCAQIKELYPQDTLEYRWDLESESRTLAAGPDRGYWGAANGGLISAASTHPYAPAAFANGEQAMLVPPDLIRYDYQLISVAPARRTAKWLADNAWSTDIYSYYSYRATLRLTVTNPAATSKAADPPLILRVVFTMTPRAIQQDSGANGTFSQAYVENNRKLTPLEVYWVPSFQVTGEQEPVVPTPSTPTDCYCSLSSEWADEQPITATAQPALNTWLCPMEDRVFSADGADRDKLRVICGGAGTERSFTDPVFVEWSAAQGTFVGGLPANSAIFTAAASNSPFTVTLRYPRRDSLFQYGDGILTGTGAMPADCGVVTMKGAAPRYWTSLAPGKVNAIYKLLYPTPAKETHESKNKLLYLNTLLTEFLYDRGKCFDDFVVLGNLDLAINEFWYGGDVKLKDDNGGKDDGYSSFSNKIGLVKSVANTDPCILWHEMIHARIHHSKAALTVNEHALVYYVHNVCEYLRPALRNFEGELKSCVQCKPAMLRHKWDQIVRDVYFLNVELPFDKAYQSKGEEVVDSGGDYDISSITQTERDLLFRITGFQIDYSFLQKYRVGQCGGCCAGLRPYQVLPPAPAAGG